MRGSARLGAITLSGLLAIGTAGCALRVYGLGELQPVADAYNRNAISCLPTAIGNLAGLPGYLVVSPIAGMIDRTRHPVASIPGNVALWPVAYIPGLVGGAIVGTPFVPFSYLADEEPCRV